MEFALSYVCGDDKGPRCIANVVF